MRCMFQDEKITFLVAKNVIFILIVFNIEINIEMNWGGEIRNNQM